MMTKEVSILKDLIMVQDKIKAFRMVILDKMIMREEMDRNLKIIIMIEEIKMMVQGNIIMVQDIIMMDQDKIMRDRDLIMMLLDIIMMLLDIIIVEDSIMIGKNQTVMVVIRDIMINNQDFKEMLNHTNMKTFIMIKDQVVI